MRDVPLGVPHGAGLERDVEADLIAGADDELGRAAADVDDQHAISVRPPRACAQIREPRLLRAAQHLRVEREALAQLARECPRVGGVAHGAGRHRRHHVGCERLVELDVARDRVADLLDRLDRELPGGVHAAAEPRHRRPALDLPDRATLDVSDEQSGRVRPHVEHGHAQTGFPAVPGIHRLTLAPLNLAHAAGWSSQVARRAHNPEVAGSNPAPATHEEAGARVRGREPVACGRDARADPEVRVPHAAIHMLPLDRDSAVPSIDVQLAPGA